MFLGGFIHIKDTVKQIKEPKTNTRHHVKVSYYLFFFTKWDVEKPQPSQKLDLTATINCANHTDDHVIQFCYIQKYKVAFFSLSTASYSSMTYRHRWTELIPEFLKTKCPKSEKRRCFPALCHACPRSSPPLGDKGNFFPQQSSMLATTFKIKCTNDSLFKKKGLC